VKTLYEVNEVEGQNEMKKLAPIFILIAGILWGCLGIFVRQLNNYGLFSMDIVLVRAIVTCIFMAVFLLCYDRNLFKIKLKDIWCFVGTGICSIVFFNYCYFKAISMTSLAVAAILLYTAPAIVMILSFLLFKEALTKRKIISLIMTFAGCVLVTGITTEGGNITGKGILTGLGAGLGYALYSIFSRYALQKGYHSFTITFYTFLISSIAALFLVDTSYVYEQVANNNVVIGLCICLGIICTVIPYLTYTIGLKYLDNSRASIIASVEPVTASIIGIIIYNERITFSGVAGIVLVLVALFICNKTVKRRNT
jgi:drug/metabolite transporter (DMT)-like permease